MGRNIDISFNIIFSVPVDVGEDVADDAELVEASSSPQSNGKLLQVSD